MNKQKGVAWLLWLFYFAMMCLVVLGTETVVYKTLSFLHNQNQNDTTKVYKNDNSDNSSVSFHPTSTKEIVSPKNILTKNTTNDNIQNTLDPVNIQKTIKTPVPLVVPQSEVLVTKTDILSGSEIIFYTNLEREKKGLSTLKQQNLLTQAATAKLNHMFTKEYFAHDAPSGESVAYWVDNAGYNYLIVGENLAMGFFQDSKDMVTAWMNSPGHRANILKKEYIDIGVAVKQGKFKGNMVWMGVQIFATSMNECLEVDSTLKQKMDTYIILLDETKKTLEEIEPVLSAEQPITPEESKKYFNLIEQYNELATTYNKLATELKSMVSDYNSQIKNFNACIFDKQGED